LGAAKVLDEIENEDDPTVLEYIQIQKENGIQPTTLRSVRASVGAEREQWRLAMQAELDSLRTTESFQIASTAELRAVGFKDILPMKMVCGIKRDGTAQTEKKKARCVVCGNFQPKSPHEDLYTANADITSVRAVLAASVGQGHNVKVIDVKTAFLNASLPESFETVYVRPPQALVDFGLVEPGTVWRVLKAIYGLRVSPKAWGIERDKELKRMQIKVKGQTYVFEQSAIDPSVWLIVRGALDKAGVGRPTHRTGTSEGVESGSFGYIVVYVDDFLIVGSDPFIDAATTVIKAKWKITDKPTLKCGSGKSVEYLSVDICAVTGGCYLSQSVYTRDMLAKWSMDECRPIGSLDDVLPETVQENEEPLLEDVRTAQRLAGGLNWLATRTRPDLSFYVSQLASAATKQPVRAIAMGKRCLRYLAGTRDHGLHFTAGSRRPRGGGQASDSKHSGKSGRLVGLGDASYEEGWSHTGVIIKMNDNTIGWTSTKQPQVPRSTAEAECTAMAYASQVLEGFACLHHSMRIRLELPKLFCDNRAAVHLSTGSNEWRTKALTNLVWGVRSLIELGFLELEFKPTADMEADLLTKYMGNKILSRQRQLVGCVPPPRSAHE